MLNMKTIKAVTVWRVNVYKVSICLVIYYKRLNET